MYSAQILVVDDEKISRKVIDMYLANSDYDIHYVESGEEALGFLEYNPGIDLVLLDLLMVGMDGFELLDKIMQDPKLQGIKAVVMSALDDPDDVQHAIDLGAACFISKPLNPKTLISTIKEQLVDVK